MATYTIKTDAYMATYKAQSSDDAIRQHAAAEGQEWESVKDFFDEIEGVEGAWAWIHSDGSEPRLGTPSCYDRRE